MSRIEKIILSDLPPFQPGQEFVFKKPPTANRKLAEVQLITGENGTGKTRILSAILAANGNLVVIQQKIHSSIRYFGHVNGTGHIFGILQANLRKESFIVHGGNPEQLYPCIAHRASPQLPLTPYKPYETKSVPDEVRQFDKSSEHMLGLNQLLVNSIVDAGVAQASGNLSSRSLSILTRMNHVMKSITHKAFNFSLIPAGNSTVELAVTWQVSNMRLHQAPDGLRAIFFLLYHVTMSLEYILTKSKDTDLFQVPFCLVLDEPETYLHPKWQRMLLPALQEMFPNAQIFCATHSPFVISSVNQGFIHILRYNDEGKVVVDPPKECCKGDTYQDAVADVLGLSDPLMDYDPETQQLLEEFESKRKSVRSLTDYEALRPHAETIANRSTRLSYLMGQQMHQLKVQLERSLAKAHA
jgi:AAA domain, putative AbiEii toxin, Type IV TA system